ncbi:hypothetical protein [Acinetobacter nosocomialis]|uniref:hypothetical protein n=1 Tax=Acinetobacter nosocomialis TaxID=106654 RepID=UPI00237E977F|nr:hypothetical protein [Acinetobacter nosocomialis]MDE1703593.1 hypothetical protein [Acinetobacter nosocomialis]HDG7210053.1 hypothetical protein [Acinetobacter nosocomialis]
MKHILLILLVALLAGCDKSSDVDSKIDYKAQFEKSDALLGTYLHKLDSTNTPLKEKEKILCESYPAEYKQNYMPALLATSKDYTEDKLLSDLKAATDYYKEKLGIKCFS